MKNYHFCISGGDEIIFRSDEDYIRAFNTLALAVSETGTSLFADAIMSTHLHGCVRTDNLQVLLNRFWKSYTRYFFRLSTIHCGNSWLLSLVDSYMLCSA